MTAFRLESTSIPSLFIVVRVAVTVRLEARTSCDAQKRMVLVARGIVEYAMRRANEQADERVAQTLPGHQESGNQSRESSLHAHQKGESFTVRFDTTTFRQREKRRACGRPCASVGRAAHQMSAWPAIVPLFPVISTSVRFQPPIIGSYPVLRSSQVWEFAPSVPCGPRHSTLQA